MINLKEYALNNSIKLGRKTFVPKRYLVGFIMRFKGMKASSIFKEVINAFNTNAFYRSGYDSFVEETFELGEMKRIIAIKDKKYFNMLLIDDKHIENSLVNGCELIKEYYGASSLSDLAQSQLLFLPFKEVEAFIERKQRVTNCGINQNLFDFAIARYCLINNIEKNNEEIRQLFYSSLIYGELLSILIDNVSPSNRALCLRIIRSLSVFSSSFDIEISDISRLKLMSIEELLYRVGDYIYILMNVLDYCSDDSRKVVAKVFNNYISKMDAFDLEIVRRRNDETLDAIGKSKDLTRERIRQIEKVEIEKFNEYYFDALTLGDKNLIFVFPKVSRVFPLSTFKDELGSNYPAFRNLFQSIKYAGDAVFCKDADAVFESQNDLTQFKRVVFEVFGDYFKISDLEEKIAECVEMLSNYNVDEETIRYFVDKNYHTKKSVYVKNKSFRFTRAFMVSTILENHFDDGFHFSDRDHVREMNRLAVEEFGEEIFTEEEIMEPNLHIVQAVVERTDARLVGRGTYVHASKAHNLPFELMERIVSYINGKNSPIEYSSLFEVFKDELEPLGITNKYALHGALSPYEGELFNSKRDYARPIAMNQTLRDSMVEWVSSRVGLFTYEDFKNEFKGVALSVFVSSLYAAGGTAYYWQQGYIVVSSLHIEEQTKQQLYNLLTFLINQYHKEYCSADEIYNLVNIQMRDFIVNCGMRYSYDLFSVLQVLFADEFKFRRPLIGSKTAVFENKYEIVDGYLATNDVVNLTKLRKFVDSKLPANTYYSVYDIILDKWNEFVPIDVDTIIRKEKLNISEREIIRLDVIIEMLLESNGKVNIEDDIVQKYYFKEIANIQTNRYLIFGIVNTFLHDKYMVSCEFGHYRGGTFYIEMRK